MTIAPMRLVASVAAIGLALVASFTASEAKSRVDKNELGKFQGSWTLASGQVNGKPVASKHAKQSRLTFSGKAVAVYTPDRYKQTVQETIERLDPKRSPREMDWARGGKVTHAIYEFDGKNRFTVCFDPSGKRPTGFDGAASGCQVRHVWQRAKQAAGTSSSARG